MPKDKTQYQEFIKLRFAEYESNYNKCLKEEDKNKFDESIYHHDKIYWAEKIKNIKAVVSTFID